MRTVSYLHIKPYVVVRFNRGTKYHTYVLTQASRIRLAKYFSR